MFFRKKKIYQMDLKQADSTLQSVFAACEKRPNIVGIDKLRLRRKLNTRVYDRLLLLTALLLLLTFLSPFAVAPVTGLFATHSTGSVELLSDSVAEDVLTLTFNGRGILFENAYQELPDGSVEAPVSYDKKSKTICFPYHAEAEVNIYIPIKDSADFHLIISPK